MLPRTQKDPYLDLYSLSADEVSLHAKQISQIYTHKYKPFGRLVKSVMRASIAFLQAYWEPPMDLYVNVYHIIGTDIPSMLGLGIYHSAVHLGPVEVAFGGHPYENETGVFFTTAKQMGQGARFYQQQYVGQCFLTKI